MALTVPDVAGLPFVFVIGFNKTATTALTQFLAGNGLPGVHWDKGELARRMLINCLDDQPILQGYDDRFRVFSDMVVQTRRIRFEANQLFRVLDRDYPGAFFIHNTRPMEDWIASRSAPFRTRHKATNLELEMIRLNTSDPDEARRHWRLQRRRFERDAARYFANHSRYLVLDIDAPDLPGRLSALLGRELDPAHWVQIGTNERPRREP